MAIIDYERGIRNYFIELGKVSRYKANNISVLNNGVYRIDVNILYGLTVRFIIDPMKRMKNIFILGQFKKDKFFGLKDFRFDIDFEKLRSPKVEAKKLEPVFISLSRKYRFRLKS